MQFIRRFGVSVVVFVLGFALAGTVLAQQAIVLKNGYVVRGSARLIPGLNLNAFTSAANSGAALPIAEVDDGLKRIFVYNRGMVAESNESPELMIRLKLWQQLARSSKEIASVSNRTYFSEFNEYGRRIATTATPEGPLEILQGITEINARYVQIQGLETKSNAIGWDMRVSTAAIPGATFQKIFEKAYARDDFDQRLDVVNFFIEAQRFDEARDELKAVMRDFPQAEQLPKQLQALTQRQSQQILDEAIVRRDAGQYQLAAAMWRQFLSVDGIALVKKLEAQDRLAELDAKVTNAQKMLMQLREQIAQLPEGDRGQLLPFVDVMASEMTMDTLVRLSDYERLGAEKNIAVGNRVALAVGGWILGGGSGLQNLSVATSLIKVRELVFEYLSTADAQRRSAILAELEEEEGAQPEYVYLVLRQLPPPLPLPTETIDEPIGEGENARQPEKSPNKNPPGYFELEIETSAGPSRYCVQLPPEYHPLRKYPTVVALHPLEASPEAEIQWWAGAYNEKLGSRAGQAGRRGYVVIAPKWSRDGQAKYEYTPIEHERVLTSLRDAMRRVSIDSDRVFLAGHLAGASAAWDIAFAHPDLWAGLISVGGDSGKYVMFYEENGRYVPMYFVTGEIAGAPSPLIRNGGDYDKYMKFGYEAMIVLYRGRGDETFYEDINNIFDWMDLSAHQRVAVQKEIEVATMREGDNFFWWIEMPQLLDEVAINPVLFDHVTRKRDAPVIARVAADNTLLVRQVPARSYNILLSPEMGIDMRSAITIRVDGGTRTHNFQGKIAYMLEDARRRADRQHVYWDQVTIGQR